MALLLGIGICLVFKVIGDYTLLSYILGIIIEIIGIFGTAINYPIYKAILNKRKEKYAL